MSPEMQECEFTSTLDRSREPYLLYLPTATKPVPLVVGLHTWSCDRFNQIEGMLPYCRERGWGLLLPEFRGPNLNVNPRAAEACASPLARQDILDSLDQVIAGGSVDSSRVFLLGASGGGHMALMMAAHAPGRWRGVSSWVPITDLAAWHGQNPKYAPHIAACCGGTPGSDVRVDTEYRDRSPIHLAQELAKPNLSVHHGRFDASVPFSHTSDLAQKVEQHHPERFFYEIFDGGHEIHYDVAFRWFDGLAGAQPDTPAATG